MAVLAGSLAVTTAVAGDWASDRASATDIERWLRELSDPANPDWQRAEADIEREWSRSGSAAFDLLLRRGEAAIEAGDYKTAIGHLTALTDQAPDFAEGWNARATAYFLAGLYGPAMADLQCALALNPRSYDALSGLGVILDETGRKESARAAFRASLAINPHQDSVKSSLDAIERELGGTAL